MLKTRMIQVFALPLLASGHLVSSTKEQSTHDDSLANQVKPTSTLSKDAVVSLAPEEEAGPILRVRFQGLENRTKHQSSEKPGTIVLRSASGTSPDDKAVAPGQSGSTRTTQDQEVAKVQDPPVKKHWIAAGSAPLQIAQRRALLVSVFFCAGIVEGVVLLSVTAATFGKESKRWPALAGVGIILPFAILWGTFEAVCASCGDQLHAAPSPKRYLGKQWYLDGGGQLMMCGNPMTITNWMRVVRTETGSALPIVASFCGNAALVGVSLSRSNVSRQRLGLVVYSLCIIPVVAVEHEVTKDWPEQWSNWFHTILGTSSGFAILLLVISTIGDVLYDNANVRYVTSLMACCGFIAFTSIFHHFWTLTALMEYACVALAGLLVFEVGLRTAPKAEAGSEEETSNTGGAR